MLSRLLVVIAEGLCKNLPNVVVAWQKVCGSGRLHLKYTLEFLEILFVPVVFSRDIDTGHLFTGKIRWTLTLFPFSRAFQWRACPPRK